MLWKETAFPRCRATDSRWNKNAVSLGSSVTAVILRLNSCVSSTARWFHVPAVSIATGTKTWLLASCLYFASLVHAALSAAAPAMLLLCASFVIISSVIKCQAITGKRKVLSNRRQSTSHGVVRCGLLDPAHLMLPALIADFGCSQK